MKNHNFEVIARLREDLNETKRNEILGIMADLSKKLKIVNLTGDIYCKAQPINNCSDFGAVCGFYVSLKDQKEYFSKLEYHDYAFGEVDVAV